MKDAAIQLVDTLSMHGTNKRAKFGIVPFAAMVKANLPAWAIRSDATGAGCTQDRRHPFNTLEDGPSVADDSKWGEVTSTHNCSEMGSRGLDVVDLTNDHSGVKNKISAMQPYLWTHIALGAEMGFQMLSPTGVFGKAAPYNTDKTIKVAIILTDGMQTAPGWAADGTQTPAAAEANLLALCSAMKAQNIKVFTIGYDLADTHTLDLLKQCAGSGMFFDANDIQSGLIASFNEIGERVRDQMVRLSE
ncbi:MAG: VWA domain-containing protein [Alphaproteobacteria bacterium]|nr:VWA domain-containing protein [Alphaproteobacteria bacterium]